ncbi:MAG: polyhydroxyalkanoate depolymerase [Roseivivax sp.]|nr:polyhydroxyalkanoate depolymerase [Roseivivax sp.]
MLYATYQGVDDFFGPLRTAARVGLSFSPKRATSLRRLMRHNAALLEMLTRFRLTHARPSFGIRSVPIDNREVPVSEEVVLDLPFGQLVHFRRDIDTPQPKVLVVAPLSGHFATLLAGTVRTLLRDHEVYITDWKNARDVPADAGAFGVEDYVAYVIRFLEQIGPGGHVLAVCQPCVQTLAAVAVMSEDRNPATPLSMTLMAGPVDVRESPTMVNRLATEKPLDWFQRTVIATVPLRYPGAGRRVYPGFVQLSAFMQMNMDRHRDQHRRLYDHLVAGEDDKAEAIKAFYDEYFAVLDLTEEFYIDTIDRIFQRAELATGAFHYRGRLVNPAAIRHTALLTVEGGRDDICGLGQTSAAHDLCAALRPHLRRHHLQANVGHYGVFNGRRWENEIYPVVRNTILAME